MRVPFLLTTLCGALVLATLISCGDDSSSGSSGPQRISAAQKAAATPIMEIVDENERDLIHFLAGMALNTAEFMMGASEATTQPFFTFLDGNEGEEWHGELPNQGTFSYGLTADDALSIMVINGITRFDSGNPAVVTVTGQYSRIEDDTSEQTSHRFHVEILEDFAPIHLGTIIGANSHLRIRQSYEGPINSGAPLQPAHSLLVTDPEPTPVIPEKQSLLITTLRCQFTNADDPSLSVTVTNGQITMDGEGDGDLSSSNASIIFNGHMTAEGISYTFILDGTLDPDLPGWKFYILIDGIPFGPFTPGLVEVAATAG